jgi:predicted transcriptional regulator of viral defense system
MLSAFHGLSTQASATVCLAATTGKTRLLIARDQEYRLVVQLKHKFFGAVEVEADGGWVKMAEPEKTISDSLDRPADAGDIPELAAMLMHGQGQFNWKRLANYSVQIPCHMKRKVNH